MNTIQSITEGQVVKTDFGQYTAQPVQVSHHLVAVIDGVIHDTHDCSRAGQRCVYAYWQKRETT